MLEYVLFRVLNMNYYSLSEPAACRQLLNEYKSFNDPIRAFAEEILPQCTWDLLPFTFLYDLYKAWTCQTNPCGSIVSDRSFKHDLLSIIPSEWTHIDKQWRPKNMMNRHEPLLDEYHLNSWKNKFDYPSYYNNNFNGYKLNDPNARYRGLIRTSILASCGTDSDDDASN